EGVDAGAVCFVQAVVVPSGGGRGNVFEQASWAGEVDRFAGDVGLSAGQEAGGSGGDDVVVDLVSIVGECRASLFNLGAGMAREDVSDFSGPVADDGFGQFVMGPPRLRMVVMGGVVHGGCALGYRRNRRANQPRSSKPGGLLAGSPKTGLAPVMRS